VSLLIIQPFVTRAIFGTRACIILSAAAGASATAWRTTASAFDASKLWPGTRPIRFMRCTMPQSVSWGGYFFISSAA
jgi:hypothetical protein